MVGMYILGISLATSSTYLLSYLLIHRLSLSLCVRKFVLHLIEFGNMTCDEFEEYIGPQLLYLLTYILTDLIAINC